MASLLRKTIPVLLLMTVTCFGNIVGQTPIKFHYLKVKRNHVKTTHDAKYTLSIDRSFKFLGVFNHQPVYSKRQFNVSVAAFTDGVNLIMVHAEEHTDGSGGLDYSELKPTDLSGLKFTAREQCASQEDAAELDANPEILYIRNAGFDLRTPMFLRQLLATSAQGNAEIVISYGRKVANCDTLSEEFKRLIEKELTRNIHVKK